MDNLALPLQFHIGINTHNTKNTEKAIKAKKSKRNTNKNSKKNMYNYQYNPRIRLKFAPYYGPRWEIPSGITVTQSIKYKFERISTYKMTEVFKQIRFESSNSVFNFRDYPHQFNSEFSKLPFIRSYLTSLKDKDQNEWKKVIGIYSKIFKVIRFMNKLVCLRRLHICMKKQINVEDIVTMEIPKKPVYVINYPTRCTYVYEAETLRKVINNRLLISDWMFDNPQAPINLLSNEPFTIGQSISIYNQMKAYGIFSWIFDRFKAHEFNLKVFRTRFKQQLKIAAIESHFTNEFENSKETVIEFFEANAINQGVHHEEIDKFKTYYKVYPNSSHNRALAPLVKRHYIAFELNDQVTLAVTSYEIIQFIDRYLNSI